MNDLNDWGGLVQQDNPYVKMKSLANIKKREFGEVWAEEFKALDDAYPNNKRF